MKDRREKPSLSINKSMRDRDNAKSVKQLNRDARFQHVKDRLADATAEEREARLQQMSTHQHESHTTATKTAEETGARSHHMSILRHDG